MTNRKHLESLNDEEFSSFLCWTPWEFYIEFYISERLFYDGFGNYEEATQEWLCEEWKGDNYD